MILFKVKSQILRRIMKKLANNNSNFYNKRDVKIKLQLSNLNQKRKIQLSYSVTCQLGTLNTEQKDPTGSAYLRSFGV